MGFTFSQNEIKFYNDNGELCCFECGSTEEIQMHHIVPKSRGGEKMISICYCCHQLAHHKKAKSVNHRELVSEGITKSRAAGTQWRCITPEEAKLGAKATSEKYQNKREELCPMIDAMRKNGMTYEGISGMLNSAGVKTARGKRWSKHTVLHLHKRWSKDNA